MQTFQLPVINHTTFNGFIECINNEEVYACINVSQDELRTIWSLEFAFIGDGRIHKHFPGNIINHWSGNSKDQYLERASEADELFNTMCNILKEQRIVCISAKLSYQKELGLAFKTSF